MRVQSVLILSAVLMHIVNSQFPRNISLFHSNAIRSQLHRKTPLNGTNIIQTVTETQEIEKIKRKICKYINITNCDKKSKMPANQSVEPNGITDVSSKEAIFVLASEPADLSNDTTCMKFRFPKTFFEDVSRIRRIDLFVRVKKKNKKRGKPKRNRQIRLTLSLLCNCNDDRRVIGIRLLRPVSTGWIKFRLPIFVVQKLRNPRNNKLEFCLACERCNRRIKVTFPLKMKTKKRVRRIIRQRQKPTKLRQKRPFLLIRERGKKTKHRRHRRQLSYCRNNNGSQYCCRSKEYIPFNQIGLNNILHPRGFYRTSCQGTCGLPQNVLSFGNTSSCVATHTSPFRIFVVTKRNLGYITINDGVVRQCGCIESQR